MGSPNGSSMKDPHSATSETTPLLAASPAGPTSQTNEEPLLHPSPPRPDNATEDDEKPFPRMQIFLLCYARLVEPIAFFSIFPFINKMIWETGDIKQEDVGFYSGLIESLFSLTQMMLMIIWGRAADRFGRKPVLVLSLAGVAVATALFGLSRTLWQMIVLRCFAGVFAGTVVTIRTMIAEHSTPKTQARAFSFFAFTSNFGIFLGPLVGGLLSEPAEQYPSVFGKIQFFNDYPYALPTFVTGLIGASAAIITILFVTETLETKSDKDAPRPEVMSTWDLLKSPGVAPVLYIYGHVMLLALAYTAVLPIFLFTSPSLGGFGFTPLQISIFLGVAGLSQALWTLLIFPPLHTRIHTIGILWLCTIAWPTFFLMSPLCNLLLLHSPPFMTAFWIIAPTSLILGSGVSMAFTGVQLALNDISPNHRALGTLNALALTLVCGIRAIAPALFASLFAVGVSGHILGGHLVWVVLVGIAVALVGAMRWLPAKAGGRPKREEEVVA